MSRLKIVCPDAISDHAQITLDDQPMWGVTEAVIRLKPGNVVEVTMTCDLDYVDLEMETIERVFEGTGEAS